VKTILHLFASIAGALVFSVISAEANAQDKPSLLVVASAHFANPGLDAQNFDVEDVLTERRRREIEDVVKQLAEFRPTHIAIEMSASNQAMVDERYAAYRAGQYELSRSEAEQLGMRLAAELGHARVHAVDWNGDLPGDDASYDWYAYAEANGHSETLAAITNPENARRYHTELKDQTIGEWLLQMNDPAALAASHAAYFDIATIGDGDELIGANWVGTWYARNLKIFTRLAQLPAKPEDRVLVVYGQGHAYLLRQFARESGAFNVVELKDVLAH
jgi:hypothetical protein